MQYSENTITECVFPPDDYHVRYPDISTETWKYSTGAQKPPARPVTFAPHYPPISITWLTFLSSGLVTAIHLHCLERAFEAQNSSGLVYLDRLLLSLIYHSSKDDDHARAMRDLASAQKRRCIVFSNRFPELNHQARSLSSGRQGIRAPKDTDNGLSDSKVRLPRYVTGSLIIPSVTLAIR